MTTQGITDLTIIRQSLKGCEEITLPFKFPKQCWVKYITINGEDESFMKEVYFKEWVIKKYLKMVNQLWGFPHALSLMRVKLFIVLDFL